MPIFTPGRRWQPAYRPFKKESLGSALMEDFEYIIKGPLFGCRMCGNCLLQETAFICPMECPKGLPGFFFSIYLACTALATSGLFLVRIL